MYTLMQTEACPTTKAQTHRPSLDLVILDIQYLYTYSFSENDVETDVCEVLGDKII